jgi:hypothetical protein
MVLTSVMAVMVILRYLKFLTLSTNLLALFKVLCYYVVVRCEENMHELSLHSLLDQSPYQNTSPFMVAFTFLPLN